MTLDVEKIEGEIKPENNSQPRSPGLPQEFPFLIFFLCFFALSIDPALIYHGAGLINNIPSFYVGREFFLKSIDIPGGLLHYASAFLTQLFALTWRGSLVLTLQAAGFCWCIDVILRSLQLDRWRVVRFVPALLLIILYANYVYEFPTTMAALTALSMTALYTRVNFKSAMGQGLGLIALAAVLYVAAGGALLLFVLLCILIELLYRKRVVYAALALGLGLALPYGLGMVLYQVPPYDAYSELLPFSWKITAHLSQRNMWVLSGLWTLLPVTVILAKIALLMTPPLEQRPTKSRFWNLATIRFGWNVPTLLCLIAILVTSMTTRDLNTRLLFQVDYDVSHGHWDRVLQETSGCAYHELICHAVNRSLYHTDRLGEDLFCYPQKPQALLLSTSKTMWHKIDACIEIGLLNEAENALLVCMELYGERPQLLERLTWLYRIKGDENAARVYQNTLDRVPFYPQPLHVKRDEATLQAIRTVQLNTDAVGYIESLPALIKDHHDNRMAYHYLMTQLLLQKKIKPFVQVFKAMRPYHTEEIPRLYQEALLLYLALSKQNSSQELGVGFSQELQEDAQFFINELQRCQGDKDKARAALQPTYGQSFFYYFFLTDTPTAS